MLKSESPNIIRSGKIQALAHKGQVQFSFVPIIFSRHQCLVNEIWLNMNL